MAKRLEDVDRHDAAVQGVPLLASQFQIVGVPPDDGHDDERKRGRRAKMASTMDERGSDIRTR
jgi:hypothetical protein